MAGLRRDVRLVSARRALATAARRAAGAFALAFGNVPSVRWVAREIWCATKSLAEYAWDIRWRRSWPRKIQDSVHTTRNTSPVIASTSLVFSLMGESPGPYSLINRRWVEWDQHAELVLPLA